MEPAAAARPEKRSMVIPRYQMRPAAARGAGKVSTAVLLEKPHKRAVNIQADYVGFECPDYFVVGYGMDVAHSYRQLPFVGVIETDDQAGLPGI